MLERIILFLLIATALQGCRGQDPDLLTLQLRLVSLDGRLPLHSESGPGWNMPWGDGDKGIRPSGQGASARLSYLYGNGDTLSIGIQEFRNDIEALGFLLNSGYLRENIPVIKGDIQEKCLRAGRRIFVFTSPSYRPVPAYLADQFVRSFPGYRSGLPREFFALPIKNRIPNGTSVQQSGFAGTPADFPMLVQRYGDPGGTWQCARSWSGVSSRQWNAFLTSLQERSSVQTTDAGVIACSVREGCMWLDRLADGRIVAVYGDVDLEKLSLLFILAKRSLMEGES